MLLSNILHLNLPIGNYNFHENVNYIIETIFHGITSWKFKEQSHITEKKKHYLLAGSYLVLSPSGTVPA
jgi:hypothetical protein